MADKNIQMTQRNAANTGWDNLYPVTKITNVLDLAGKIISESGSNSNGYYVRFADGTQICWHTKYTTNLIDTPHGNVYYSGSDIWTFPASFKIPPKFFSNVESAAGYSWAGLGADAVSTTSASFAVFSPVKSYANAFVSLMSIGNWK